jgi:hypothetical protein
MLPRKSVAVLQRPSNTIAYGTGNTRRLVGQEVHLGSYLIVMEKRSAQWVIVEHASFAAHE